MSLKNKIILIFAILFISLGLMQFAINRFFILPTFINLENDEAVRNLKRIHEAINREIRHLDDTCHDWGAWDDSYEFMETASQDYISGNLPAESFQTANLNLIYFLDTAGNVFWGKIYDLTAKKEIDLDGFSSGDISGLRNIFSFDSDPSESYENVYKRGVLLTEKGPLMLAARPILTSEHGGPPRGTIIMGKFLTDPITEKMKEETKVNFRIHENNSNLPGDLQKIRDEITPSAPYLAKETKDRILIYCSFFTMQGRPAFLIETVFPREVTQQGIKAIKYSLFFLMLSGFVILFIVLMLLENVIIKPIVSLSHHMTKIEEGNYDLRIRSTRKDVIGKLANGFDNMIAKIESQTEQLEKLSSTDGLTGIPNRRFFDETLAQEWNRTSRQAQLHLSAIMCDVDFFKLYNDQYGHQSGDNCLKLVADTIKKSLKRPTDSVARYGGEEFVVLLPNTSPEGAQQVAEEIRSNVQALRIKHERSEVDDHVTLSLGVSSMMPSQNLTPYDLIKAADNALYDSKKYGRNMVVFRPVE